jgi:hypothetical protein
MPEKSMDAARLREALSGVRTVSLATVTAKGEARVAPIQAIFHDDAFWIPTVAEAARTRHAATRPGVSVTYYEGTDLAVIAHGDAEVVGQGDERFAAADEALRAAGGDSPVGWSGTPVYLRLAPGRLYTFARHG